MQPSFTSPPVPDRARPVAGLLGDALRRPGARRGVTVLTVVLLLAGVALFSYPVGTDLYSDYRQRDLQDRFAAPAAVAAYQARRVPVGDGLTTLRIPALDVDVLVVEGTTPAALRAGAGHYVDSALPGEVGNVAIAGHRTTYGRPLNRMDQLVPGDVVHLETPLAVHTYTAVPAFDGHANPWVVSPTELSVVRPDGGASILTLTTCQPKGSARQRLIMRFELTGTEMRAPRA